MLITSISLLLFFLFTDVSAVNETLKKEALEYLKYLDGATCQWFHDNKILEFQYNANATDENLQMKNDFSNNNYTIEDRDYPWRDLFDDPEILRQAFKYGYLTRLSVYEQSAPVSYQINGLVGKMVDIFTNLKNICRYNGTKKCDLTKKEAKAIFYSSNDLDERNFYWEQILNGLGKNIKPLYSKYVALSNKYAQFFNFSNIADSWKNSYEGPPVDQFESVMLKLYDQLAPLYKQMFAFVRKRFYDIYGPSVVNRTGPIPVTLTGGLVGLDFGNIDLIKPYPNKEAADVTKQLQLQNYTVVKMAKLCEDFYLSLGLPPMPDTFWKLSQFEEPKDATSTCFTQAYDFYDRKDYRILACEKVKYSDWLELCHEMGHVKYYMDLKNQPCCYRGPPNGAINEGVADVAGLSLSTTERLSRFGLLENPCKVDLEVEINRLFLAAIDKISFLPFGLILDLWRWRLFEGKLVTLILMMNGGS
uniref:Angiotensin-converting enzyme n=1 Tax=Clastoptera arizonana TaxID=38151 RepID=A0A1B6DA72_9HEMI